MIEISLHGKTGEIIAVEPHPDYVDFPVRDSRTCTSDARLGLALENFVAPIVAGLNRKTAIETYPDLSRAVAELAQKHPGREDGRRVLDFLAAWGRPHPQARWHVAGAESVSRATRFVERATMPRVSATSLTADPLAKGVRFIGEAERMDEMEVDELGATLGLGPAWDDISGAALLQREVRIQPTGGGTKSRIKKDRPPNSTEIRDAKRRHQQEDGLEGPREKLSVRVRPEIKTVLFESGVHRELIEAVGIALITGKSVAQIRADLENRSP